MAKSIVAREEYTDKSSGETKVAWNPIGILVEANGKQYVKLNHNPGTLYYCFDIENKDKASEASAASGSQY